MADDPTDRPDRTPDPIPSDPVDAGAPTGEIPTPRSDPAAPTPPSATRDTEPTPAGDDPAESTRSTPPAPRASRRRAFRVSNRAAVALLCGLLGLSLAAQLRNTERDGELPAARQEDLVRILDELENREQRVRLEISELEQRRRALNSAAKGSENALADLRRRAVELGILAGTQPAEGPGVRLVFRPGRSRISADIVLDAVQELRGAGAEALQIAGNGGAPVRVVASTAFVDVDSDPDAGIEVDGRRLRAPYTLLAVGDEETMAAAMRIPGGVADTVGQSGGTVLLDTLDTITISAVRAPTTPRYAKPVS